MTGLKIVTTAIASTSAFVMTTAMALAMDVPAVRPGNSGGGSGNANPGNPNVASVPEIDASTGLLAIAAVLAMVAFVWERNRRQRA